MDGMAPQQQEQSSPSLCSNGCGFYSSVATEGLCSKCYREQAKQSMMASAAAPSNPSPSPAAAVAPSGVAASAVPSPAPLAAPAVQPAEASTTAPAPPAAEASTSSFAAAASAESPAPKKQPSPTRCFSCNKKVGLTGFSCKCQPDAVFCATHRYAEAHECAFDYKALGKQQLEAKNPQVQASKLQRL